jgi:hypothetical protein
MARDVTNKLKPLGESIYKQPQSGAVYVFGRARALEGKPSHLGGYILFTLRKSYNGHLPGGIERTGAVVKDNLTYPEAVALIEQALWFQSV